MPVIDCTMPLMNVGSSLNSARSVHKIVRLAYQCESQCSEWYVSQGTIIAIDSSNGQHIYNLYWVLPKNLAKWGCTCHVLKRQAMTNVPLQINGDKRHTDLRAHVTSIEQQISVSGLSPGSQRISGGGATTRIRWKNHRDFGDWFP